MSNSDNSPPGTPSMIPKDMPLRDRMNHSFQNRAKRVKQAIENKAKTKSEANIEDVAALHSAAEAGNVDTVRFLLEKKGVDPNCRSANGNTVLHTAVRLRNLDLIKALIVAKGIDINALDNDRRPAIAFARSIAKQEGMNVDGPSEEGHNITINDPNSEETIVEILNTLTSHGAMCDDEYFMDTAGEKELTNNLERSEVIDAQLIRKVVITMSLPFIFLIFVNGPFFALKFLVVTVVFYFIALGYFVSEVMIKPPWWFHTPDAKTLRLTGCPDYWEGKLHNPKRDLKLEYTDITVTTHDGISIKGWFVPSIAPKEKQSKMCIVMVHGGGRDRRAWLRHVPFLAKAGYSCVLFDMRDHGLSSGPSRGLMFGLKERYDLLAVCAYARERLGFKHVAVMGTSIGGSTAIMGAALDPKIDLVIAENPLLTAAHLQDKHIQKMFGPYFNHAKYSEIIFSVFRFMCSNWLNFKLNNKPSKRCQSVHVIGKLARPILLMHGTYDDVVPFYHSETLFNHAQEPKELWLVPEAVHCCLHNKQPQEFEARVLRFLAKHDPSVPLHIRQQLVSPQQKPSNTSVSNNSLGSDAILPTTADPKEMKATLAATKVETLSEQGTPASE
eukprot:GILI01007137.1.p1 GENE.GILI01007137.1~~GILI01007137.1.p1  ORF type:complete len:613 (-),score=152.13 GILI01007137.1:191-2029(-)